MKPHVLSFVPAEDLAIFDRICQIFRELPEIDLTIAGGRKVKVSCHMVSRALAGFFPLTVEDGYFGGLMEHSWLVTENGLIIDPYPCAVVGGPIMVDPRYVSVPWSSLYQSTKAQLEVTSEPWFQDCVARVRQAVEQTMTELEIPIR